MQQIATWLCYLFEEGYYAYLWPYKVTSSGIKCNKISVVLLFWSFHFSNILLQRNHNHYTCVWFIISFQSSVAHSHFDFPIKQPPILIGVAVFKQHFQPPLLGRQWSKPQLGFVYSSLPLSSHQPPLSNYYSFDCLITVELYKNKPVLHVLSQQHNITVPPKQEVPSLLPFLLLLSQRHSSCKILRTCFSWE